MVAVNISEERFREWFAKILKSTKPSAGLELLFNLGILQIMAPTIYQERMAFTALFKNLDLALPDIKTEVATKLAFLLHLPKAIREVELTSLGFEQPIIEQAGFISQAFDTFLSYSPYFDKEEGYYARHFLARIKNDAPNGNYEAALSQIKAFLQMWDSNYLKTLENALQEPVIGLADINLNGRDVIELDIPPGPRIRNLLWQAHNWVLKHPKQNTREDLLGYLKTFLRSN